LGLESGLGLDLAADLNLTNPTSSASYEVIPLYVRREHCGIYIYMYIYIHIYVYINRLSCECV
jgi:hypothetical protein